MAEYKMIYTRQSTKLANAAINIVGLMDSARLPFSNFFQPVSFSPQVVNHFCF
jgi:hypothetical protein